MSDLTPSDDELISSCLDGEATLDEVARIQADPELLARVQEFENAKGLLSTPVPPLPQSDVDRLISNALAESATSDRVTDLSAVRASRMFNPARLATIAAAFLLLAGVVGALFALNNAGTGDMTTSGSADDYAADSDYADDYAGDDGDDMAESAADYAGDDIAESAADGETAEAMPEADDDMADEPADGDDMAEEDAEDPAATFAEPSRTVAVVGPDGEDAEHEAAPTMTYRLLNLEIAESYETLDELIDHTAEQWPELVDAGATVVPQVIEEQGIAEQALADVRCGQRLHAFIDTLDHIAGSGGISVGETTIADTPITIVVVELSFDTAELLAASEPNCAIDQLASLGP